MIESAHPEDLITLALAGNLGEAEWRVLRTHLAVCRPCSTQLRVAGWMEEPAGNNLALSHLRDRMTLSRVLDSWEQAQRPRRLPVVPRWVLATGVALAVSGAAAAMVSSWTARRRAQAPREQAIAIRGPVPGAEAVAPALPEPSSAAPIETTEPATAQASLAEEVKEVAPKRPELPAAGVLFAHASEQRLKGQSMAALATFKRLQELYPDSRESATSHLVVGRVWLENQRPELAAPEFARYLKSGGAASEEALVGHATALRRLGKFADEAGDWQRLLAKFPHSLYAAGASRRLAELQRIQPSAATGNSIQP